MLWITTASVFIFGLVLAGHVSDWCFVVLDVGHNLRTVERI